MPSASLARANSGKGLALLPALLVACLLSTPVAAAAPAVSDAGAAWVPGEVLVKFKPGSDAAGKARVAGLVAAKSVQEFGLSGVRCLAFDGLGVDEAVARCSADPAVEYAEPNYIWHAASIPNDPRFGEQWSLRNTGQTGGSAGSDIDAAAAWDLATDSGTVVVAIIDSGVDYGHPDLAANIWTNTGEVAGNGLDDDGNGYVDDVHGYDFANLDGDPMDDSGHGTQCAGVVGAAGNNSLGITGVCWKTRVMCLKFMNASNSGTTSRAIASIEYAVRMGARVLNASWSGSTSSTALHDAIWAAGNAGVLFVAAAGNNYQNIDTSRAYPAAYPTANIVAVSSTGYTDALANSANWGPVSVDLCAPGDNILTTFPGAAYGLSSGTSMSCPQVTGALALILARHPGIRWQTARDILFASVDAVQSLQGKLATGGRLNLATALAIGDATPPAPVGDLVVADVSGQWVDLEWTATGDDGHAGAAASHEVRYATHPITNLDFDAATAVPGLGAPQAAGSRESVRVSGLSFNTRYWFAVRARDEIGLASEVVASVEATTLGPPAITIDADSLAVALEPGGLATRTLAIGNAGAGELAWTMRLEGATGKAAAPAILVYSPGAAASDAYATALRGTGLACTYVTTWTALRAAVEAPPSPWDLVIVNSSATASTALARDALAAYLARGGRMIYADWGVSAYADHPLLSRLGVAFVADYQAPLDVVPLDPAQRCFTTPNAVAGLGWNRDQAGRDGQFVRALAGARSLATFPGHPEASAIVLRDDGATLFNAFQAVNFTGDGDGDGVADMVELAGNEIALVLGRPDWLRGAPLSGTIPAGGSTHVVLSYDAAGICGGERKADLVVTSSDPVSPVLTIPAVLDVAGAPVLVADTDSLSFAPTPVGAADTLMIGLSNAGCEALTIRALSFDAAVFRSPAALPIVIEPGAALAVPVTFAPSTVGPVSGSLGIQADETAVPLWTVRVFGDGTGAPSARIDPATLDAALEPGTTASRTLAIGNDGMLDLAWTARVEHAATARTYRLPARDPGSWPDPDATSPDESAAKDQDDVLAMPGEAVLELRDLSGFRILWDRTHGQESSYYWSGIVRELRLRGAEVVENRSPLTAELLATFDVVWLVDQPQPWTDGELVTLAAWVRLGGGLLLEGDQSNRSFNRLLATAGAGITLGGTCAKGYATAIGAHAATAGIASLYLGAPLTAVAQVEAPASLLARDVGGVPALAWSEVRSGRIMVLCDEMLANRSAGSGDDRLFGHQVIDWLAGAGWVRVEPATGLVGPGAVQDVAVTLDARARCGGAFTASIRLATNDPLRPEIVVPVAVDVLGRPEFQAGPDSLAFGAQFIGGVITDTVQIANPGCEVLHILAAASDHPEFGMVQAPPFALAPGETRRVGIAYTPATVGAVAGTLTITSDDPDAPFVAVRLTGTGVEPPRMVLTPGSFTASAAPGDVLTRTLVIGNEGLADLAWSARLRFDPTPVLTTLPPLAPAPWAALDREASVPPKAALPLPDKGGQQSVALADLHGVRILWDLTHGQDDWTYWSTIIAELRARGATVELNSEPLTADRLSTCDILWEREFWDGWQAGEVATLVAWLRDGGGLLLEGDQSPTVFNTLLSAAGAGIAYGGNCTSGATTRIFAHPTTAGVASLYLQGPLTALATVTTPAGLIVRDQVGVNAVAWSSVGRGRIIACSDEMFDNSILAVAGHRLFGHQVIDWLSGPTWMTIDHAAGVVAPGGTEDVGVTFTAPGPCDGAYGAEIVLESNDPLAPRVEVPAHLDVVVGPEITAGATSLQFGSRYIGTQNVATFTLTAGPCGVLEVGAITSDNPEFTVSPAGPFAVAGGQSTVVSVSYRPATAGPVSARLTVPSNDRDEPLTTVIVEGSGMQPPVIGIAPDSLAMVVTSGMSTARSLTIRNTGLGPMQWAARPYVALPPADAAASASYTIEDMVLGDAGFVPAVTAAAADVAGGEIGANVLRTYRSSVARGSHPRVLVFASRNYSWRNAFVTAAQRMGLSITVAVTWPTAITALKAMGPWDVVIFDCDSSNTGRTAEHLVDVRRFLATGRAFIFGDTQTADSVLLESFGVSFVSSLPSVKAVNAVDPGHQCFTWPNRVTTLAQPSYSTGENGVVVSVRSGATCLATFQGYPDRGAIVLGARGRTLYNAFNTATYGGDADLDGISDAGELAENEIRLAMTPAWLDVQPTSGELPPGGEQLMWATADGSGMCNAALGADVAITSNDIARPEVDLSIRFDVQAVPDLACSPQSVAFGSCFLGGMASAQLRLVNSGCGIVDFTGITSDSPQFTIDRPGSFFLEPESTRIININYRPQALGDAQGIVTIAVAGPSGARVAIPVSGTAVPAPVAAVAPDSLEMDLVDSGTGSLELVLENRGEADLAWSLGTSTEAVADSIASGGWSAARAPRILVLSTYNAAADPYVAAVARQGWIGRVVANWDALGWELAAHGPWDLVVVDNYTATCSAPVLYYLTEHVDRGGALIYSDSGLAGYLANPLFARLGVAATLGGYSTPRSIRPVADMPAVFAEPNPLAGLDWSLNQFSLDGNDLSILPGAHRIAAYLQDPSSTASVLSASGRTICNGFQPANFGRDADGDGVADMVEFAENQVCLVLHHAYWLSAAPGAGILAPGQSQRVDVTFDAGLQCDTRKEGWLVLSSNDPLHPRVVVRAGMNVPPLPRAVVSPTQIAFGAHYLHTSVQDTVLVGNSSCGDLRVTGLTFSSGEFSATPEPPFVIANGGSRAVIVTYAPTVAGPVTATMTIATNEPGRPARSVALAGTGVAPPLLAVSPDSLSAVVEPGSSGNRVMTIRNDGADNLRWSLTCGAIEVPPGQSAPAPKILLVCDPQWNDGAFGIALKKQGLTYYYISNWNLVATYMYNYGPWDLVIVDSGDTMVDRSTAVALEALYAYVNGGGALIFGDWWLANSTSNTLLAKLGVAIVSSTSVPLTVEIRNDGHPVARRPNAVTRLVGTLGGQVGAAQVARVVQDGTSLATFPEYPNSSAIVWGSSGRTIFNGFLTRFYVGDGDGDQVRDAVELAENELALVGFRSPWLSARPVFGVLAPGMAQDITVHFDAARLCGQSWRSSLILDSNDPLHALTTLPAVINVPFRPAPRATPAALDFGARVLGSRTTLDVTVENTGCAALHMNGASVDHGDFVTEPAGPFAVAAGGKQVVRVSYLPSATGPASATLTFAASDVGAPPVAVALAGSGFEPPVLVAAPDSLAAAVAAGDSTVATLRVANEGRGALVWTSAAFPLSAGAVVDQSPEFTGSAREPGGKPEDAGALGPPAAGAWDGADSSYESPAGLGKPAAQAAGAKVATPTLEEIRSRLDKGHPAVTALIPNRHDFSEGVTGTYILDGGGDMYDAGNALGTNLRGPLTYSDNVIVSDGTFGNGGRYFTRKVPGLFVLAADLDGVTTFQVSGNLGADGAGRADAAVLTVQVSDGRQFTGFVKRVYGAGDASVNHLVIVESGSSLSQAISTNTDFDIHEVRGLAGSTRLYYLLYSSVNGGYIDNAATTAILKAFLSALGLGFDWLRLSPAAGNLEPGASVDVAVTFKSVGLDPGDHQAAIHLFSVNSTQPTVLVPVRLRVDASAAVVGGSSVAITACAGGVTSSPIMLAVSRDATDGYESRCDQLAPEATDAPVRLGFRHPEWPDSGDRCFSVDQRAPFDLSTSHKTWRFDVTTDQAGSVTLATSPGPDMPPDVGLQLLDLKSGIIHDLRADPGYVFDAVPREARSFAVRVGVALATGEVPVRDVGPGWSMVGLPRPAATEGAVATAMLSAAPAGSSVLAWDGTRGGYASVDPDGARSPGGGLWLHCDAPFRLPPVPERTLDTVRQTLRPGWNLVGYPLWFPGDLAGLTVVQGGREMSYAAAAAAGLVGTTAFDYDGERYTATRTLLPWRSFWLACHADSLELRCDHEVMAQHDPSSWPAPPAGKSGNGDWALAISVVGGRSSVQVGQAAGADDGLDAWWDLPLPPPAPGDVAARLSLPRPSWSRGPDLEYQSDFQAIGGMPDNFEVRLRAAPGVVRLAWDPAQIPAGLDLALVSSGRVLVRSLRLVDSVDIVSTSAPLDLELVPGSADPTASANASLRMQNRPNPFNPETEISFNLPAAGSVELLVYDARGVLVRRLVAGNLPAGPAGVTWNGRDTGGQPAASGVYLYRLFVDGRQQGRTGKMVLMN